MAHEINFESTSNGTLVIKLINDLTEEYTYEAIQEMSREIARTIANKVFEDNKERIISSVNIDLVVAEVQKVLLEKIKAHSDKPESVL